MFSPNMHSEHSKSPGQKNPRGQREIKQSWQPQNNNVACPRNHFVINDREYGGQRSKKLLIFIDKRLAVGCFIIYVWSVSQILKSDCWVYEKRNQIKKLVYSCICIGDASQIQNLKYLLCRLISVINHYIKDLSENKKNVE